jgi:hypothetical protein
LRMVYLYPIPFVTPSATYVIKIHSPLKMDTPF